MRGRNKDPRSGFSEYFLQVGSNDSRFLNYLPYPGLLATILMWSLYLELNLRKRTSECLKIPIITYSQVLLLTYHLLDVTYISRDEKEVKKWEAHFLYSTWRTSGLIIRFTPFGQRQRRRILRSNWTADKICCVLGVFMCVCCLLTTSTQWAANWMLSSYYRSKMWSWWRVITYPSIDNRSNGAHCRAAERFLTVD